MSARLSRSDVLLPLAVAFWAVAVGAIDPRNMTDFGLLPALPVTFFAGLAVFVASSVVALTRPSLSAPRLWLHVVALVLMLHGIAPLVFSRPEYAWVYKHVGVVQYIAVHGTVDGSVDLYQNWPGFFALAAWFDAIAGIASPIDYAAWAPAFFDLLTVVALAFALGGLTSEPRRRWLALFLFAAGDWVGQDYFAPQALAFLLSLLITGIVLRWFRAARTAPPASEPGWWPRAGLVLALNVTFAAMVVSHQLSPFIAVAGMAGLCVAGVVRPWWLLVVPVVLTVGYLVTRLGYLTHHYHLLTSLNPLANLQSTSPPLSQGLPGRQFAAGAARALSAGIWALALVGALRRFRRGETVAAAVVLMIAPAALVFGQDYGGEAIYRVYLFSLPWAAFLAASALTPAGRWARRHVVASGGALAVAVALFVPAYLGLAEVDQVTAGEVDASEYVYAHGQTGSTVVLVAPNFPVRAGAGYDRFVLPAGAFEPTLLDSARFQHRVLGAADIPAIEQVAREHEPAQSPGVTYLVISEQQEVYAKTYGLLPDGSVDNLERALDASPEWRVAYRNQDAVVYQLVPFAWTQ